VFVPGTSADQRTLIWRDMDGRTQPLSLPADNYFDPSISPDGSMLALVIRSANDYDVWLYNVERDVRTRFTFGGVNRAPVWAPDGTRIAFYANAGARPGVYVRTADGQTQPELLFPVSELREYPNAWSPDGRVLTVEALGGTPTQTDVVQFVFESATKHALLRTTFQEHLSSFSPDGKWMAYTSNESGEAEVYVQAYPPTGGRWQISSSGGAEPRWSPDGRQLFFRSGPRLMATTVHAQPAFRADRPRMLFDNVSEDRPDGDLMYAVARDGGRFLMMRATQAAASATRVQVAVNWASTLTSR
jgi:Tol biopolymer transport system component